MRAEFLDGNVSVTIGDITQLAVDAIVNAANSTLLGGGGVDGAIHRKGGPAILEACRELRRTTYPAGLPTGEAVLTTAGRLPARFVIHTVGPIWGKDPNPAALLASCYRRSIAIAESRLLHDIAFPAISTGAYGYPPGEAAIVVSETLVEELARVRSVNRVQLVFFSKPATEAFLQRQRFGPPHYVEK